MSVGITLFLTVCYREEVPRGSKVRPYHLHAGCMMKTILCFCTRFPHHRWALYALVALMGGCVLSLLIATSGRTTPERRSWLKVSDHNSVEKSVRLTHAPITIPYATRQHISAACCPTQDIKAMCLSFANWISSRKPNVYLEPVSSSTYFVCRWKGLLYIWVARVWRTSRWWKWVFIAGCRDYACFTWCLLHCRAFVGTRPNKKLALFL